MRTSNSILVPYTVPQFNSTMKVKFKLENAPGLFIPQTADNEVEYTITKPLTNRVLSFNTQDLGNDKEFDEDVDIVLSATTVSTSSDITVPITITYTPENSTTPSKTVADTISIVANALSGTLTHTTLKYHDHIVRFEADLSGLSGVTMDTTKNYSEYVANANEVNLKLSSGSGSYASDSLLTVQAKTVVASYSDMIVKSRYRTKFGTSPFGAWQETTAAISKGNTQNGFNLSYNLPTFTQNGTIEIELLGNEAGNAVLSDGASDIHAYTGTITHQPVTREISFDSTTLPDAFAGQVYTAPMVVSQSFSADKDIPIKIEYIDRTSNAVLETDNTQSVMFLANSLSADFTQTAPTDKHNVWVKITAVPVAGSNIAVNSLASSATMQLDGYLFEFDSEDISDVHSAGDVVSFTLNSSGTIIQAITLPVEFRATDPNASASDPAPAWVAASPVVTAYGNVTSLSYTLPSDFTSGGYVIEARVNVGASTGIYDANDVTNTGYIQSNYNVTNPATPSVAIEFITSDKGTILSGGTTDIAVRYAGNVSLGAGNSVNIPFIVEYRDSDDGNKLIYTDTVYNNFLGSMSFVNLPLAIPFHHNYEVTVTADPPAGSPITLSTGSPSTKFTIIGYEMALDDETKLVSAAKASAVSVTGTFDAAFVVAADMPYRFRKRIYGEAWQAWEYATVSIAQSASSFTLTATTPNEDYTYVDIEFELIDNPESGFYVELGNSKTTVNVTNSTVPAATYSFTGTSNISTKYYTGQVVNYNLAFTSAVNKDMLIPMKAVISDRTTLQVTAIDKFTVSHTSGDISHALSYTLPDDDNKYVTFALDLPANNSLFTPASASEADVRYILDGYQLKFNSADVVTSTVIPGNSIDIEVARQLNVTYNNVTATMQRRTQIDDGTWGNWLDFAVNLGTTQNTTFSYVLPHFDALFNMQVRLKPGGDSGVQWDSNSVTTYNYNAISQTVQTGTIRMIGNDLANPTQARPGEDVTITIQLYNDSDSTPNNAVKDITVPIRATVGGKESDTLLIPILQGSSTGSIVYPAPLNDNGTVTIELISNDDADAPLQSSTTSGFESTTFIVRAYDMSFAGVDGAVEESLTLPGEMITTVIHPHYSGQDVIADIDITLMRRIKVDGADWGLWETVTVTMPKGTKYRLGSPAGFDYDWEVPAYNTSIEVELQLVEAPEQGIVIAFDKKELAKYAFYKQYRVEYEHEPNNALYKQENYSDGGGTLNIPIKFYGPKKSSATIFKAVFLRQSRNRNRDLNNKIWERGEIDVTIPANTVSGSTINVEVMVRARANTGYYRYILYLDSKLIGTNRLDVEDNDTEVIDGDNRRVIDIYFPVQLSHRFNQTTSDYADAYYTMSLQDYNEVSGSTGRTATGKLNGTSVAHSYKTKFYLPLLVRQKTLTTTYLNYKIRSRPLNVDGTIDWGDGWSGVQYKEIPAITETIAENGNTIYVEFTLPARSSLDSQYGIEYEIELQSNGSNYSLANPTDLNRTYTVNQWPLVQHNVTVQHITIPDIYDIGGNSIDFSSYNKCTLSGTSASSKFDVPITMLNGSSAVDTIAPNVKVRRRSQAYYQTTGWNLGSASSASETTVTPSLPIGAAPGDTIGREASIGQAIQSFGGGSNYIGRRVVYSLEPASGTRIQEVVVSNTDLTTGRIEASVFCKY